MKIAIILLSIITCVSASAQTQVTDIDLNGAYTTKNYYNRGTCHDPSVFIDKSAGTNPTLYIYGSHLAAATTTASSSYQDWTYFGGGETNSCTLFANTSGTRVGYANAYNTHAVTKVKNYQGNEVTFGNFNAHNWQSAGNNIQGFQWAPDIIYNKTMQKYCMYMSINGDNWASVIVCLTSNNPTGPWVYQGPVVFSGFQGSYAHVGYGAADDWKHTDLAIATGCTSLPDRYKQGKSWGSYWPNSIDPCVFYDENDNLWLSYGSWSGGIFMLRLNKKNGLRDYTYTYSSTFTTGTDYRNCLTDPYFGKKIAGGYYDSGEASYIQHVGEYYYLWVTNGGLTSDGGYQMRVFRSKNPDGPYVDPWGLDAIPGKALKNFGADAGRDYGVKVFGNYKWDLMPLAELAQGHNSVLADPSGRTLLVNHVRFNDGTEGHQVRIHQCFLTQDGWLVVAPFEFKNESITDNTIATTAAQNVAGDYQLMIHKFRQDTANKEYATPVNITLNSDGTITSEYTGTWSCPAGTSYINIRLNNVLGTSLAATFHGVVVEQTIDYSNIKTLCFTACGTGGKSETSQVANGAAVTTSGLCIWGSKTDYKAAIKYTLDKTTVPFSNGSTISSSQVLPRKGYLGAKVFWTSSDQSIMTNEGVVKGDGSVTMTLNISKDGYIYKRSYNINVNSGSAGDIPTYYPVSMFKNTASAWWTNFSTQTWTLKAGNSCKFLFYNYNPGSGDFRNNWSLYGCSSFSNGNISNEYFGVRNDNWDNTSGSNNGCSSNYDWNTFVKDMNGSLVDMTCNYSTAGVFNMQSVITTTDGKVYNYSYSKTIASKPSQIVLFFVSEHSYIDGQILTGMPTPVISPLEDGKTYNLAGQQVDSNYRGVVIKNGKKLLQKKH